MKEARELKIPKTLLELEGNTLFNFNPAIPLHGQGVKLDLPPGPLAWNGNKYDKDANGNYRFVYSGKDAQAGRNVNAIILEIPAGGAHQVAGHRPHRQRLGRELGAEGVEQGRDDPRRPPAREAAVLPRAPVGDPGHHRDLRLAARAARRGLGRRGPLRWCG